MSSFYRPLEILAGKVASWFVGDAIEGVVGRLGVPSKASAKPHTEAKRRIQ